MKLVLLYLSCFSCAFYSCLTRAQTNNNGVPICAGELSNVNVYSANCSTVGSLNNMLNTSNTDNQKYFQEIALGHVASIIWENSRARHTKSQLAGDAENDNQRRGSGPVSSLFHRFIHDSRYDFRISSHKFVLRLSLSI